MAMGAHTRFAEETLGSLLAVLKPAPAAWVTAAMELPRVPRGLHQILALAQADAEFRRELLEDLDQALSRAGVDPDPALVRELRERLTSN
jgi:hypothetical protein